MFFNRVEAIVFFITNYKLPAKYQIGGKQKLQWTIRRALKCESKKPNKKKKKT
jgi:hypothetical protein